MSYEIGIDVGGTFTDFVVRSSDSIFSGKVLTTPNDETVGIMNTINTSAEHFDLDIHNFLKSADNLILGTTAVTNTINVSYVLVAGRLLKKRRPSPGRY